MQWKKQGLIAVAAVAVVGTSYYIFKDKKNTSREVAAYGNSGSSASSASRSGKIGGKNNSLSSRKSTAPTRRPVTRRLRKLDKKAVQTPRRMGSHKVDVKKTFSEKRDWRGRTIEVKTRTSTYKGKSYVYKSRRTVTPAVEQRASRYTDRYAASRRSRGLSDDGFNPALMMMIGMYSGNPLVCAVAGFSGACFMGMLLHNDNSSASTGSGAGVPANGAGMPTDGAGVPAGTNSGGAGVAAGSGTFAETAPPEVMDKTNALLNTCILESDAEELTVVVDCMNEYLSRDAQLNLDSFCRDKTLEDIRQLIDDNMYLNDGGCESHYNMQLRDASAALEGLQNRAKNESKEEEKKSFMDYWD